VLEAGRQPDLPQKAIGPHARGERGVEDLEGDGPVVPEVGGQVDGRHAAAAQLPLDAVAIAEGGIQRGQGIDWRHPMVG